SKVTVLDNSDVDCNQIVLDYFSGSPPFETKDSKKYEFPDAIMAAKLKILFSVENPIYIISNDSGFKSSFNDEKGFNTFESLKEVFNLINMETKIYENITSFILNPNTHNLICAMLTKELNNKDIDLDGLDCDRKGICEGYNYEEVYIDDISQVDFDFSSVDDITEDTVNITLSCTASITAICSYLDESNSAWDSEEDEYIYAEWESIEEKHQPNFDCEVIFSINRESEEVNFEIESIYFDISLDQRTRVSRRYIESEDPDEVAKAEEMEALEEYHKH
ncbi:PIN domain-containing protein, partial [Clostridium sp. A1-XYC3]